MSTVGAVAGAVVAVAGVVMWFLGRKSAREAKANEPGEQNRKRKEQIAAEIATGDGKAANVSLDNDLRRVNDARRLRGFTPLQGDSERPGGEPNNSGH